jgi:hypothetical protein
LKISGFTFVRNATLLYYPLRPSIESILPVVDEYVVALGEGDDDDRSREEILAIGSPKIRIIDTRWDLQAFPGGTVFAQQTDIAKSACSGDWLFYLQCDEAMHERYLDTVQRDCGRYLHDPEVEGFLFRYRHFYGDYWHYHRSHDWYPREIRIIRNDPDIHSWRDAQSFRHIPGFDGRDYHRKKGTRKLRVLPIDAEIYHYGWVRPPTLMARKNQRRIANYTESGIAAAGYTTRAEVFDYGPLQHLARYDDDHPAVMSDWIARFDWGHQLQYSGKRRSDRKPYKHETLKDRILTFIEQKFLGGRLIGGFKNYRLLKKK